MTDVNIPLLRKAVEWAEAESVHGPYAGQWHQGSWFQRRDERDRVGLADARRGLGYKDDAPICETAYCIAGWAVVQHVGEQNITMVGGSSFLGGLDDLVVIPDLAQELLGLDDDEAEDLFDGGNSIADIRRIAERIAGEAL